MTKCEKKKYNRSTIRHRASNDEQERLYNNNPKWSELKMRTKAIRIRDMTPQKRKILNPEKLNESFGIHFQRLMEDAGLTVAELRKRLALKGHEFSEGGIRHWMRGGRYPSPEVMQALAKILVVPDYRHILPPEKTTRSKK